MHRVEHHGTSRGMNRTRPPMAAHPIADNPASTSETGAGRAGIGLPDDGTGPDGATPATAAPTPRRRLAATLAALAALAVTVALPQAARAQWSMPDERPASQVVLELYTAQGCSACPPADAMMRELAMREDVIALALHVDYWDYIGWADTFGRPENTERQTRYARRNGHSTIYTPQVVINGIEIFEGFRVAQVMSTIAAYGARPPVVALDLSRSAEGANEYRLDINARRLARDDAPDEPPLELTSRAAGSAPALLGSLAAGDLPDTERVYLQLVRYRPSAHVHIHSGENAGRQVQYYNIVTDWREIGEWDMRAPLEMSLTIDGSSPAVVILQEPDQGEIIAAARLR